MANLVFGEESEAFGQIHAFDRAEATFNVSPISTSAEGWSRTTGFLDVNEQRIYDSDRSKNTHMRFLHLLILVSGKTH